MPEDIRRFVQEVLHNPLTVQIGHSAPAESVSHAYTRFNRILKTALLKEILRNTQTESVLVFTRLNTGLTASLISFKKLAIK